MRKILVLLFTIFLLLSCRKEGFYHTYYGDIDTDTLIGYYDKGSTCYIVKVKRVDSAQSKAMGVDTLYWVIYYKPIDNTYLLQVVDNLGGCGARTEFDPLTDDI